MKGRVQIEFGVFLKATSSLGAVPGCMQGGSSSHLSGKILVLECIRNLLSPINDPDQGLELENPICSASYGFCAAKKSITMHRVDLLSTRQPN